MVRHILQALLLGILVMGSALAVPKPPAPDDPLAPARIEAAKRLYEAQYAAAAWRRQMEQTLMAQFSAQMMNAASDDVMHRTEAFLPELAKRVSDDFARIMHAHAPVGTLVFARRMTLPELEASLRVVQSGAEPALDDVWLSMALAEARFRYHSPEPAGQPKPQTDQGARMAAETLLDVSGMSEDLAARNLRHQPRQQLLDDLLGRLTLDDMQRLTDFYREGTGRKYFQARAEIRDQLSQALQEAEFLIQGHVQETCAALGAACEPSIFTMVFYPWRMQRTLGKQASP
jgi:hypothetical protein